MGLPVVYRRSNEITATYSFSDVADGTGVIIFYGFVSKVGITEDYHLTDQSTILSHHSGVSSGIESTDQDGSSANIDLDFDLTAFNNPRKLRGTAIVQFSLLGVADGSAGGTASAVITIRKWDGTTETDIATATTPEISFGTSGNDKKLEAIPITIPKTRFKKGETLRLNVNATATKTSGTGNVRVVIGNDPQNRDGTYITPTTDDFTTQLVFHAPFDLDL